MWPGADEASHIEYNEISLRESTWFIIRQLLNCVCVCACWVNNNKEKQLSERRVVREKLILLASFTSPFFITPPHRTARHQSVCKFLVVFSCRLFIHWLHWLVLVVLLQRRGSTTTTTTTTLNVLLRCCCSVGARRQLEKCRVINSICHCERRKKKKKKKKKKSNDNDLDNCRLCRVVSARGVGCNNTPTRQQEEEEEGVWLSAACETMFSYEIRFFFPFFFKCRRRRRRRTVHLLWRWRRGRGRQSEEIFQYEKKGWKEYSLNTSTRCSSTAEQRNEWGRKKERGYCCNSWV